MNGDGAHGADAKYEGKDWLKLRAGRTDVPAENQRRIVAQGDRVYVTLSHQAPMSILDAASGEIIETVAETASAREILVSDGVALRLCAERSPEAARRRGQEERQTARLVAVQAESGDVLWQQPCGTIRPLLLTINGGRIIYLHRQGIGRSTTAYRRAAVARDDATTPIRARLFRSTALRSLTARKFVAAYDAADGTLLWSKDVKPIGGAEGEDLFVIDGLVWRGVETVDEAANVARKTPHALLTGWDLRTGEEKKRIFVKNIRSPEHHHRCYRNKATSRYLISSMEGAEFLDLTGDGPFPGELAPRVLSQRHDALQRHALRASRSVFLRTGCQAVGLHRGYRPP